ncbi:MAG: GWxTD domain-containing protein [candidate division KSB1 bacterium]|nr:GWxTD domain-containing protein [candidate division KSB1 bacterium]
MRFRILTCMGLMGLLWWTNSAGQVVINVRSDTSIAMPGDSVLILKRLLKQEETNLAWQLRLGELLLEREQLDDAEQAFQRALQLDSMSVAALTGLGRVHLQREPSKIIPFEKLKELIKQDHKSRAIKFFKQALAIDPAYHPAQYFLGRTYLARGDPNSLQEAEQIFARLASQPPFFRDVIFQLGYCYQKMGKLSLARQTYHRIKPNSVDYGRAQIRLAEVFYGLGEYRSATESFFQGLDQLEDAVLLDELFDELKVILSPFELNQFEAANSAQKKVLMKKFWKQHDPDPSTPENERLMEHFRRVMFARDNFHFTAPPYYDDRGKIYIKYGPPDDRYNSQVGSLPAKDNESWSYESIEKGLVFDFVSESGYYRLVDDLSEAALPGYDFNSRLAVASQLYQQRSHMSAAYSELTVGFSWDRLNQLRNNRAAAVKKHPGEVYIHDFHADHFPFVTRWAQFRGDSAKTRIELYTGFPMQGLKYNQSDSGYSYYIDFFIEVLDTNFNSAHRISERYSMTVKDLNSLAARHFLLQNNVQLQPGPYHLAAVISTSDHSAKGVQKSSLYVKSFTGNKLMISDIQLSLNIVESTHRANRSIVKNNLSILPYPFTRVMRSRPIHLYFEIYNLSLDERHRSDYEVSYTLTTIQPERSFWDRTFGGIARMLYSRPGNQISTQVRREGESDSAFEYLSFDLSNLSRGVVELKIRVNDLHNQQFAESAIQFTLIK